MFKKLALMSAAAAFAVPMAVSAAPISLDGYYVNSTFDPEGAGSDDGDGLGVRLMVPFQGSGIRIHGEYQTAELDDSNVDLDQLRLGASFMTEGNARFGAVAEYVNITLDGGGGEFEPDGYGIHGRGEFSMSEQFQFYGQIGYVDTSDSGTDLSGIEYLIGGVFNITPMWGIGVDYRYSDLELEDGGEADVSLEDIRIGVRVNFGT